MNILNSKNFGEKIYDRFPNIYREEDVKQLHSLYRYIQSFNDGGFKHIIDDTNGLIQLVDSKTAPTKALPFLYEQYGLEIFNGIPEEYLRFLLPRLGESWNKKGSISAVDFVASSLSGVRTSTKVEYDEVENPLVELKFEMDYTLGSYFPEVEQFDRLMEKFLPFYCDRRIVYSYVFYEYGNILAREYHTMKFKDNKSDGAVLLSSGGRKYAPSLSPYSLDKGLLNTSFILNDFVDYDIDVDPVIESIVSTYKETGVFNKSKSTSLYRKSLNEDTKTTNEDFVTNDTIDTDELVKTEIHIAPYLDTPRVAGTHTDFYKVKVAPNEDKSKFATKEVSEVHIVDKTEEKGIIDRSKSKMYYAGTTNNQYMTLNEDFNTNEGIDTDSYIDSYMFKTETSSVGSIDTEKVDITLDKFSYYASLNTGMTLNSDFYTNESHTDVGFVQQTYEKSVDKMKHLVLETQALTNEAVESVGMFLNMNVSKLNQMCLSNIGSYDKITRAGRVSYIYPTQYGCITA